MAEAPRVPWLLLSLRGLGRAVTTEERKHPGELRGRAMPTRFDHQDESQLGFGYGTVVVAAWS